MQTSTVADNNHIAWLIQLLGIAALITLKNQHMCIRYSSQQVFNINTGESKHMLTKKLAWWSNPTFQTEEKVISKYLKQVRWKETFTTSMPF